MLHLSLLNLAPRIGISVYGTALGTRGFDLNGKTLGVIGTGQIGLRVMRLATAFEMEVVAYDIHR